MKVLSLLIVIFIFNTNIFAQVTFSEQLVIVKTETREPRSVYAIDIDGDGDMDVISASQSDNKIAWHENSDGTGSFGAQQVISTSAIEPFYVYAADID